MSLAEGSPEDVREVRIHIEGENSIDTAFSYNAYDDVTQLKRYDGATIILQQDIYYASYKELHAMDAVGSWTEAGDGALSQGAGEFTDGSNVLRDTYTYSGGSSIIANTTSLGNLSSWLSSGCTTGYVSVFAKFSDFSNVTSVELRIGSGASDYRSVTLYSGTDYTANDIWFGLEFDLSAGSDTGTPDGTAVDYVALVLTIASGTSKTVDFYNMLLSKENATKISGEDFYDIHRITENWTSESKTYEYTHFYDFEEYIRAKKTGGAY